MTITYITSGNILTDESKAIVIPVNTMGIAGAGSGSFNIPTNTACTALSAKTNASASVKSCR